MSQSHAQIDVIIDGFSPGATMRATAAGRMGKSAVIAATDTEIGASVALQPTPEQCKMIVRALAEYAGLRVVEAKKMEAAVAAYAGNQHG